MESPKLDKKDIRLRVALLNGLVLPGSGHIYAKQYSRGLVISTLFSVFAIYGLVKVVVLTNAAFSGGDPADLMEISLFYQDLMDNGSIKYSLYGASVVWLVGIIDSYRITSAK